MKLSPDGEHIAALDFYDDNYHINLTDAEKEQSYTLLVLDKTTNTRSAHYQWLDNDTLFVSYESQEKRLRGFLHIDYQGDKPETKFIKIKANGFIVNALADDPKYVLFLRITGSRLPRYTLYKATPTQLEEDNFTNAVKVRNTLKKAKNYAYDAVNKQLLAITLDDEAVTFWYQKPGSKDWTAFLDIEQNEFSFTPVGFLAEDKLAVLTNKDTDVTALVEFDIHTRTFGQVLYQHPKYDLTGAQLNPMGQGIRSVSYVEHGKPVTEYFSSKDQQLAKRLGYSFTGKQISVISASIDKSRKLLKVSASDDSGSYYLFNEKTQTAQLLKASYPELEPYTMSSSISFSVTTQDNAEIEAILTRPVENGNNVLLVYPHGGPVGVRDFATYNPETQYLVSRGYSVLNVNFRGSSGFGKQFKASGVAQFGQWIEKDITAAVEHVRENYPYEQACTIGSSYGGYSAMMLAINKPEYYQCVISMYGIYDLPLLFNASNFKTQEEHIKSVEAAVGENSESLKSVSPFYLAEKLSAPVLLIAGEHDHIADFEHANRMKYRLKQLSKDFEHIFYKNVGHGYHRSWLGDRHQAAYIDNFIRQQLKLPYPKSEQSDKLLADEYQLIADFFTGKNFIGRKSEEAYSYYLRSAELGNAKAMFKVAESYQFAYTVDKDMDKAIDWYKKSAAAGYAPAAFHLGDLYWQNKAVKRDANYSYNMYVRAKELEHDRAGLAIARAFCLGHGVEKNLDLCTEKLVQWRAEKKQKWQYSDDAQQHWLNTLNDILWHNTFIGDEKQQFNQFFKKILRVDVTDILVDDEEFGLFSERKKYSHRRHHEEETLLIPLEKDAIFGVELRFDDNDYSGGKKYPLGLIKVKWTLPEAVEDTIEPYFMAFSMDETQTYYLHLDSDSWLVKGQWQLEVFTLDDKKIYSKTFTTL
ncbi:prolyl oligopeptidase family serine peptidase [Thalassomonas actiniarum]|nr:prolyl oligopeptidase family serine peptidase [Thalassomonas actiniarum]